MFCKYVSSEFIQKITAIPKSMDEVLVARTNQSMLLCNDKVFCFLLSGAIEAVQWNKI